MWLNGMVCSNWHQLLATLKYYQLRFLALTMNRHIGLVTLGFFCDILLCFHLNLFFILLQPVATWILTFLFSPSICSELISLFHEFPSIFYPPVKPSSWHSQSFALVCIIATLVGNTFAYICPQKNNDIMLFGLTYFPCLWHKFF